MRTLTTNEMNAVAGGASLVFNQPLANIPVLSFTFEGTGGMLSFNGMTVPIGVGHPVVHLP